MAQHATLSELIVGVRFRLSDPREGTIGRIPYDRFAGSVDEMKLLCNETQRVITVLCCGKETALLRSVNKRIQVVNGRVEYALPDDYLDMDFVDYIRAGNKSKILPRPLQEFPPDDRYEYYQRSDRDRYKYYDVYGQGSVEKIVGVVRSNSLNKIYDPYNSFDGISVGDIVHNISDGSQGKITQVEIVPGTVPPPIIKEPCPEEEPVDEDCPEEGIQFAFTVDEDCPEEETEPEVEVEPAEPVIENYSFIQVESLTGGKSNRFVQGDQYIVASSEELNETMHVYPKLGKEDDQTSTKVFSGNTCEFHVNEPFTLYAIDLTINKLPDGFEPDDRMVVEILLGSKLASEDPPSFVSKVGVDIGKNRVVFDEVNFQGGILMAEDTEYTVRVTAGMKELKVSAMEVFAYGTSDYISINYTRLPKPMENDHSICEIPPFALELFYAQAKLLATHKVTRNATPDPGLLGEVNYWKNNIESLLWKRAERGVSYLTEETVYHREENQQGYRFADEVVEL